MISWHKPGQKVVCVDQPKRGVVPGRDPGIGEELTIREVRPLREPEFFKRTNFVWLCFEEKDHLNAYPSIYFEPVYPQAIEDLKNLELRPDLLEEEEINEPA